jgi:hypothetical protein
METFDNINEQFKLTASDNALHKFDTIVKQYSDCEVFIESFDIIDQHYREFKMWRGKILPNNNSRSSFVFIIID